MVADDDLEDSSGELPQRNSSSGGWEAVLNRIVDRIKDQGILGVCFLAVLAFVALYYGVSPTAVLLLTMLGILGLFGVFLGPKYLNYKKELKKMDLEAAERSKLIRQKIDRRRTRHEKAARRIDKSEHRN